jgi:hypothetical protein
MSTNPNLARRQLHEGQGELQGFLASISPLRSLPVAPTRKLQEEHIE